MLEAYFDESARPNGIFAVAGYVFEPDQARQFSVDWLDLFGPSGCHMKDLVAQQQAFRGVPRKERDRLLREAIQIINRRISFGVAACCDAVDFERRFPSKRPLSREYPACCIYCVGAVAAWLKETNAIGDVAYIFEAGHLHAGLAANFLAALTHWDSTRQSLRLRSYTFMNKTDAVPLQAADLLAWESTKWFDETLTTPKRPWRKSMRALTDDLRYKFFRVDSEQISTLFRRHPQLFGPELPFSTRQFSPPSGGNS